VRPQPVRVPSLFPDPPYEYAAVAPPARLVFTAGACPLDETGRVAEPGNLEAQSSRALANLLATLAAAGSSPELILKTTVYVVGHGRSDLVRVWNVIADGLAPQRPPSTLLGVAVLGYADQLVEIEAVAVVREE
jgi:enamine deaminase RidA (YjgF/YER057c/UK114 family)